MIITLCGSARFEPWYHAWAEALGLSGHMVFSLVSFPSMHEGEKSWYTPDVKRGLDDLHLQKIRASDAILVLNVFGYVGESTLREIAHSRQVHIGGTGTKVYLLETWGEGRGVGEDHSLPVQEAAKRFDVFGFRSPKGMKFGLHDTGEEILTNRDAYDLLPPAGDLRTSIVARLDALLNPLKGSTSPLGRSQ